MNNSLVRLTILFFISSFCYADSITVSSNELSESYTEEVKVSGEVRAGLMISAASTKVRPDSLYIDLGDGSYENICVIMRSIDGKYESRFSKQLSKDLSGLTQFILESEYQNIFSNYSPDTIAILVNTSSKCKGKLVGALPAVWGKPADNSLKVFLNSGLYQTKLKLYKPDGTKEKIPCTQIENDKKVAYDTQCQIISPEIYDLTKTKILRKNFGNVLKPIALPILFSP